MKENIDQRLNSEQAADFLGISKRTLRWMRDVRKIAYRRFGRECVYELSELERVWDEGLVPAVRGGRQAAR